MNRQFLKLLVILNLCSWLTVSFGIWQYSRLWPQSLVSSIIVLGVLAILANLLYWLLQWWKKNDVSRPNNRWVQAFILFSTVAQFFLILSFLL